MKRPKHLSHYKDCRGKWRCYFKRPGEPQLAMPLPIGSEAFWTAYNKALAGQAAGKRPGTLASVITEYYQSAEYKTLADVTKEDYRRQFDRFRQAHGHRLVVDLQTKHVNKSWTGWPIARQQRTTCGTA